MRRFVPTVFMVTLTALACPTSVRGESGAPAQRARVHAEAGQAAFDSGNYDEAIGEFLAAYDLVPEPMLLYNVAVCYERLERRDDAIEHYERYIREEPEGDNADEARQRLERLHAQAVDDQTAPLEVEAADEADEESIVDQIPHGALETAMHEVDLALGVTLNLRGLFGSPGDPGVAFVLDYNFRITNAWHIGGGLLLDSYGEIGGARQSQYGFFLGGRFAFQVVTVVEIRFAFGLAYQFLDPHQRAIGYGGAHFIYLRAGPTVAWDIWRGFGLKLDLMTRLGYVSGRAVAENDGFGGSLDILLGAFWAF